MATAAQVIANQANAKHSTGPITPEGKTRASQNATALGLFSASAFIRPDEQEAYSKFRASWNVRLVPDGPVEEALVGELVQAAWRLARATAQKALQRNLNELRRIQTDRIMRDGTPYGHQARAEFGAASVRDIDNFFELLGQRYLKAELRLSPATQRSTQRWEKIVRDRSTPAPQADSAKQSQSVPAPQPDSAERSQSDLPPTPRGAPCHCGSAEKYKRCCGKNAPPVLSRAA